MKYAIIAVLFLSGCVSVPVERKFPKVPESFTQKCAELQILNDDAKLSDVAKNVTENYTLYHECSLKNDSWLDWYNSQKKIFESVK